MFGEGISRSSEILDLGVELDIIKKSGSWFSYDGSKLAQGREAAKEVINDNPELADELEEKILAALYDADHGNGKKKPVSKDRDDSSDSEEIESDEKVKNNENF